MVYKYMRAILLFCFIFTVYGIHDAFCDQNPDFIIADNKLVRYLGMSKIVTVPDNVQIIGPYAFSGVNLNRQSLGEEYDEIIRSFPYNPSTYDSIEEIILPEGLMTTEYSSFSDLRNLKKINIPETVTSIGPDTFSSCGNLYEIILPESIIEIGKTAFYQSGLKNITIPPKVKHINDYTFMHCTNLINVSLPNGLEYIGFYAFLGSSNLENINIPDSVLGIGISAFNGTKLSHDVLPPAFAENIWAIFYEKGDG